MFVLEEVDADIIDTDGLTTHIKARHGLYNTESGELQLTGKVAVNRPHDAYALFTEELLYSDAAGKISCPGKTRLLGNTVEIRGDGFDYDMRTGAYAVEGRVYSVFQGFVAP